MRPRLIGAACAIVLLAACATAGPPPESTASSSSSLLSSTTAATTVPEPSTTAVPSSTTTTVAPTTTTTTTTTLAPLQGLALEPIASGLAQPTVVAAPPDDARLFVAERTGEVRLVDPTSGLVEEPFLDLSGLVTSTGIEQGLLGLTFHPDFGSTGRLFAYFVDIDGRRRLSEFQAQGPGADPGSERVLFSFAQPPGSLDIRHYGGMLLFGPDGHLWVSLGDGADARGQGQDPNTVFGTILRLDVDSADPYGIPSDNPFADGGGAPEVWAYGLRNPWRFTIDPPEGLVYIADVGQETWEEVNVVPLAGAGANLGWPDSEGNHCFLDSDCDLGAFTTPVLEYGHDEGCSITGGHVYRGEAIPELDGHYFYADWCRGWVRSFRYEEGEAVDLTDWSDELQPGQVNAFGVDASGELNIATYEGDVFRVVPVR